MAPVLVEIVGAAGAGKTTLLSALQKSGRPIEAVFSFRGLGNAFYFGQALLGLLPFLITQRWHGWSYSRKAMMWMIRLTAAQAILQRQVRRQQPEVIILDQGPVYMLTRLAEVGATGGQDQALDQWWQHSLTAWAKLLDLVILLDAPESILIQRVFGRSKDHFAKGKAEAEAKAILARHRHFYRQVVDQLTDGAKTRLLYFDTSVNSVNQLLVEIVASLEQASNANLAVLPISTPAVTQQANE